MGFQLIQQQLKDLDQEEEFLNDKLKDLQDKFRSLRARREVIQMSCTHQHLNRITEGSFDYPEVVMVCKSCGKEL